MRSPPYAITPAILGRAEEIGEAIGRAEAAAVGQDLRLRRINRVRTIRASLAIEGNRLSEDQIATILDGKPVVGPLRDIQEARNAIEVYDRYREWDPANETHLLRAQVARLLSVLQGTMSRRQIQAVLGLRDRKSLRQRYLLPALKRGYVEMTRPDAPSAANQKYRLTELGRQAKAYSAVDPIPRRDTHP